MKKFDTQTETKIGFKIMFYLIHNSIAFSFVYIILPIAWRHTTICAWSKLFSIHSHMVTSYRIFLGRGGGSIALHGLVHFLNTTGPSLTKVVYAYFDRISYGFACRCLIHPILDPPTTNFTVASSVAVLKPGKPTWKMVFAKYTCMVRYIGISYTLLTAKKGIQKSLWRIVFPGNSGHPGWRPPKSSHQLWPASRLASCDFLWQGEDPEPEPRCFSRKEFFGTIKAMSVSDTMVDLVDLAWLSPQSQYAKYMQYGWLEDHFIGWFSSGCWGSLELGLHRMPPSSRENKFAWPLSKRCATFIWETSAWHRIALMEVKWKIQGGPPSSVSWFNIYIYMYIYIYIWDL